MVVRGVAWIPRSIVGWSIAVIGFVLLGSVMLLFIYGPDWMNVDYNQGRRSDGFIVTVVVALAVGSWVGSTLERPYVVRRRLAADQAGAQRANAAPHSQRFGPASADVDLLLARLADLGPDDWAALARSYRAAFTTPWLEQSRAILIAVLGHDRERGIYFGKAIVEAEAMAPASPADAREAAGDMAGFMSFGVHLNMAQAEFLWRPYESVLPRASLREN